MVKKETKLMALGNGKCFYANSKILIDKKYPFKDKSLKLIMEIIKNKIIIRLKRKNEVII